MGRTEFYRHNVYVTSATHAPSTPAHPTLNRPNMVSVGTVVWLSSELMFFAGLLSAFLVFRTGNTVWPPPFQPRLPIVVTAVNTLVLLWSSYTMHRALRAVRRGDAHGLADFLACRVTSGHGCYNSG